MTASSTIGTFITAAALLAIAAEVPGQQALPVDELVRFYESMDGDNWHDNHRWGDPSIQPCLWHGVTCRTNPETGANEIESIRLPDNGLSGNLDDSEILSLVRERLDLSGNDIGGRLNRLPLTPTVLDLSNNRIEGPLPGLQGSIGGHLRILRLADNEFTGPVPESWEILNLLELDLSDNRLQGSPEPAFLALDPEARVSIYLADNEFSGILPDWVMSLDLVNPSRDGGINLCWTGIRIDDADLAEWIGERHMAGPALDQCLSRGRTAMDASVSGSWYPPERAGEGFSVMLLDNGLPLLYWFTHVGNGRQMWLFEVGDRDAATLLFPDLFVTRGRFGQGSTGMVATAGLRLDRVGPDTLHGEYLVRYLSSELPSDGGGVQVTPYPVFIASRRDHAPLTRLAGTTCDNQHSNQWVSGAWYNPDRSGEGFIVEVHQNGRGVVYWFTYTPYGGNQAWMMGDGDFDGTTLHIDNLIQPRDGENGMPHDASGIEPVHWGTLTLRFDDDLSGHASYDSTFVEYGAGDYPIERLARPMLAECGQD